MDLPFSFVSSFLPQIVRGVKYFIDDIIFNNIKFSVDSAITLMNGSIFAEDLIVLKGVDRSKSIQNELNSIKNSVSLINVRVYVPITSFTNVGAYTSRSFSVHGVDTIAAGSTIEYKGSGIPLAQGLYIFTISISLPDSTQYRIKGEFGVRDSGNVAYGVVKRTLVSVQDTNYPNLFTYTIILSSLPGGNILTNVSPFIMITNNHVNAISFDGTNTSFAILRIN